MTDDAVRKLAEIGKAVSEEYDADVFIYSGEIADRGYGKMVSTISKQTSGRPNVLLILVTNGGSANNAYQIARLLQKSYDQFFLYTPSYCKSAGTLVALGAHKLIMDPFSELGPLDVQLLEQNEIGARKSGLVTRSAFEGLQEESFSLFEQFMLRMLRRSGGLVSFKVAAELSTSLAAALMSPVYSQINPHIVGKDRRDLEVALHYGQRLVDASGNADDTTVHHLVSHYPSHDFIIDEDEAKELFELVERPSRKLHQLAGAIGRNAYSEAPDVLVGALHNLLDSLEDEDDESESESEPEASDVGQGEGSETEPLVDGGGRADRPGHSDADAVPGPNGSSQAPAPVRRRARRRNGSAVADEEPAANSDAPAK